MDLYVAPRMPSLSFHSSIPPETGFTVIINILQCDARDHVLLTSPSWH